MMTEAEYATHSAAMYTRAVSLAYGDAAVLTTLIDMSKNGQFPLGPSSMPDIPPQAILRLSSARIFYMLMGYHGVPIRARSLEEAMATLGMTDLGIDVKKLAPDSIREAISAVLG